RVIRTRECPRAVSGRALFESSLICRSRWLRLRRGGPMQDQRAIRIIDGKERPVNRKGRILYVADIRTLIENAKSEWWGRNCFAPEYRVKVGRSPAWWESDAIAWLEAQRSR